MEYRGINLNESVNFYKKDGSIFQRIKNTLDSLADLLVEKGHRLLSEYIDVKTKILIDFKCGHDPHWISPMNYKKGRGCPKCSGKCKEQAKEDLINLLEQNGHYLLSEYNGAKIKVLIDFQCGHDSHWITPDEYKNGRGCSECGNINKSEKLSKRVKEDFPILVNSNGHILLSDYVISKEKVLIDFNCGHEPHWITPFNYKNGRNCPKCSGKCKNQAEDELISILEVNHHVWIEGEYKNNHTKILIDFQCGHQPHWIEPYNYKSGQGCPICKESKGEKRIRKWLEENIFTFESQKEFDCLLGLSGGNLSYDFFLPKQNMLIEYQGEFHDGSGADYTRTNLDSQQEHDKIKREYAVKNNIKLLEIWYWEYENIEEILINNLRRIL